MASHAKKAKDMTPEEREALRQSRVDRLKPHRFKPGQTGNPTGMAGKRPFTDAIAKIGHDRKLFDGVILAMFKRAVNGDTKAAALLIDRMEGKATQKIEIEAHRTLQDIIEEVSDDGLRDDDSPKGA